jgi:hypothetical protein
MKLRWKQFALKCPKDQLFVLTHGCVLFKQSKSIENIEFLILISSNFRLFKMYSDWKYGHPIVLNLTIYQRGFFLIFASIEMKKLFPF